MNLATSLRPVRLARKNADADANIDLLREKYCYFTETVRLISSSEQGYLATISWHNWI